MNTPPLSASPPDSIPVLQARVEAMAGMTIASLAHQQQVQLPESLKASKGFVGQLLELCLGASAGCQSKPDFPQLNIELKSLPLSAHNTPMESTYVCVCPLMNTTAWRSWQTSPVFRKLQSVLWIPVEASPSIPLAERRVGHGLFWQPSAEEEAILQTDWEEITSYVVSGELDKVNSPVGTALHVRPKARNSKCLTWTINDTGQRVQTLPRGFYLRSSFTTALLDRYWL